MKQDWKWTKNDGMGLSSPQMFLSVTLTIDDDIWWWYPTFSNEELSSKMQ